MARHQCTDALPHLVAPTDALRGVDRVRIRRPDIDPADLVAETLAKPASSAKTGFCSMKSRAARVNVFGSHGDWFASPIAISKSPASLAAANHLPSCPGVLATKSRRIRCGSCAGYFRTIARKAATYEAPRFASIA